MARVKGSPLASIPGGTSSGVVADGTIYHDRAWLDVYQLLYQQLR
ncbi:hypothetical protein [Klebsiella pneumoniae]